MIKSFYNMGALNRHEYESMNYWIGVWIIVKKYVVMRVKNSNLLLTVLYHEKFMVRYITSEVCNNHNAVII